MSVNATSVEVELTEVIRRIASTRKSISPETAIFHDLHIAGDDAHELLAEIWRRFGVSTENKINFPTYFPDETAALGYFWKFKLGFPDKKHRKITVAHLMSVIDRGEWFDPVDPIA